MCGVVNVPRSPEKASSGTLTTSPPQAGAIEVRGERPLELLDVDVRQLARPEPTERDSDPVGRWTRWIASSLAEQRGQEIRLAGQCPRFGEGRSEARSEILNYFS
jgi:hypothetical protein